MQFGVLDLVGMQVFDLSAQGKIKCEMLAAEHGVGVDYNVADLRNLQIPSKQFDLIAFLGYTPSELRKEKFPMFITALKKVDILSLKDTIKHRCHWIGRTKIYGFTLGLG